MTELRYNAADLKAWAEFSGDFNPVHFEPERAAQMNLSAVPAHGMRVMLDVKAALVQEAMRSDWPIGPLAFKAVLRAPVLKDARYKLLIESRGDAVKFTVADEGRHTSCMTGQLRPLPVDKESGHGTAARCWTLPAWHSFSISGAQWADAFARLPATTHSPGSAWLLLDALLFSALLRQPGLFAQVSEIAGFASARCADDLMHSATVLQTHHSNVISAEMRRMEIDSIGEHSELNAIRCDIEIPVITGGGHEGWLVQATLNACAGRQFLMSTTVVLMISPISASAKQLEY